ncbi:MAG: 16S rRNA (uracil(1498)-N(3))-methyltransferase [Hyphomonadaceae bacterium]|nr:16S rRNA (uracil(1498)-N(3))-methyltransferase [Hyphomonadaceae bacterium]
MANPRLMVDAALHAGAMIALDEGQARHVGAVLRLEEGESLRLFNARDGEWRAVVASKSKRGMAVKVETQLRQSRETPDLDLLFAPVKRHATDLIIEKATELGVRRIRPVITQRTIAETVRLDRLNAIAREAAEQTERFDAPELFEAVSLAKALDGWDASRPLIYADEAGDDETLAWGGESGRAQPIADALAGLKGKPQAALLIGPEGGFTSEERRMLRTLSFVIPVSLGPRILRAETAVIAALSILQALWGDWREG